MLGHCRKRKARCMPSKGDPLGRCASCVRLGYHCVVVKVEVMEALDALGEDGTPENILQVQRLIGIPVNLSPEYRELTWLGHVKDGLHASPNQHNQFIAVQSSMSQPMTTPKSFNSASKPSHVSFPHGRGQISVPSGNPGNRLPTRRQDPPKDLLCDLGTSLSDSAFYLEESSTAKQPVPADAHSPTLCSRAPSNIGDYELGSVQPDLRSSPLLNFQHRFGSPTKPSPQESPAFF